MKEYNLLKRGFSHPVYCEDYLVSEPNKKWDLHAVFDGCSSGVDSHFASALYGKIVIKAFRSFAANFDSANELLKAIVFDLALNLVETQKTFELSQLELLSTAIIAIIDKKSKSVELIAIGDGVIVCDKQVIVINQNNVPNYLIYDAIKLGDKDFFENWWNSHKHRFNFSDFSDFSISTDGILSYSSGKVGEQVNNAKIIDSLLIEEKYSKSEAMLGRKHNILRKKQKLENFDDIAVIRIWNHD